MFVCRVLAAPLAAAGAGAPTGHLSAAPMATAVTAAGSRTVLAKTPHKRHGSQPANTDSGSSRGGGGADQSDTSNSADTFRIALREIGAGGSSPAADNVAEDNAASSRNGVTQLYPPSNAERLERVPITLLLPDVHAIAIAHCIVVTVYEIVLCADKDSDLDSLVSCASLTLDRFAEGTRAHVAAMAEIAGALCATASGGGSAARAVAAATSAAQPHAAVAAAATTAAASASACAASQLSEGVRCAVASEAAAVWAVSSAARHTDAVAEAARACGACEFTKRELALSLGSAMALVEVTGDAFKLTEAVACAGGNDSAERAAYAACATVAYTATWVNVRSLGHALCLHMHCASPCIVRLRMHCVTVASERHSL